MSEATQTFYDYSHLEDNFLCGMFEDGCPTVTIAPEGDVILVVGPENPSPDKKPLTGSSLRLRVSSAFLAASSKVFKVMFDPKWLEGQDLSSTSPKEIPLPEDDPFAMEVICCVIHCQNHLVKEPLTGKQILQIALHADKYDIVSALKYATAHWLVPQRAPRPRFGEREMVEDGYLLAAAYVLDDVRNFARISMDLITNYSLPYKLLWMEELIQNTLHPMTYYHLEERRTKVREQIEKVWADGILVTCKEMNKPPLTSCDWGRQRMEKYKSLREIYPTRQDINNVPISTLVTETKKAETADMINFSHRRVDHEEKRNTREREFEIHRAIRERDKFVSWWEIMQRLYCLCFECLDVEESYECKFVHSFGYRLSPGQVDPFTPKDDHPHVSNYSPGGDSSSSCVGEHLVEIW